MEVGMEISGRPCAGWAKVLICGGCLAVLCGAPGRIAAQTSGQQTIVQQMSGQQGIEVAAKEDTLALPDAPHPAELALNRGEPLSSSSSFQASALNQPPSSGPSLSDLGLTPAETEG